MWTRQRQREASMQLHWRTISFSAIMVIAAAAPAPGQTVAPAGAGVGAPAPRAAAIPDLSGAWSHPYLPGFEPPPSGPGPITNRERTPNGVSNWNKLVGDYTNPILKPDAAEVVKRYGEISLAGETYPTPANQCWPEPVPYVFWNLGLQMIQQPQQITMIYDKGDQIRHIRMNTQHPANITPSWYGDSAGHYEGDTLVIDTIGVRAQRPLAMIDVYGTPYTDALHVVERYRLIDRDATKAAIARGEKENLRIPVNDSGLGTDFNGSGLELQFTVEDKGVFTMPWTATITYRRALGEWPEFICLENVHEYYYRKNSDVPTAEKPDF
jgi:hypothetical protein